MLPRRHRLNRPDEFRAVIRSGARSGGRHVVVHLEVAGPPGLCRVQPDSGMGAGEQDCAEPSRVGLVVGRAVGPAVTRNLVSRRLRAHLGRRLGDLPLGLAIVVRALPSAAEASWAELTADADRCLDKALVKQGQRPGTVLRTVP